MSDTLTVSNRRWSPWIRAIFGFVLYFIVSFVPGILLSPLSELMDYEIFVMVAAPIALIIEILFIYLLMRYIDRRPFSILQLKFDGHALKTFALVFLATGVIYSLGAILANYFFPIEWDVPIEARKTWAMLVPAFFSAFFVQGIPEEIMFRAYLPQTLVTTPIKTMLISSIMFMLLHFLFVFSLSGIELIIEFFYPFAFGMFAFVTRYITRTTWAAIAVHGGIHMFRNVFEIQGYFPYMYSSLFIGLFFFISAMVFFYIHREKFTAENNQLEY
ncbi:CPBP family intramembrane glutamic endopeptidase [Fundicoccus culcitae]|uniref:CPBP family intramembrane metalloprotease n=1 Tax=Fundicoccus culcitae TaxID=2969821 RepID=A0ABY5P5R6_9LACT|nr:CPBP family intramembrane glutamic endopeptidase [Fundicoccus culcitae]UUX33916.1 CPBP family intramembrane metalloprotease [Fundicoccus culcitae]